MEAKKMTKKEMLEEMNEGIGYNLKYRMQKSKKDIETVYNFYKMTGQSKQDKRYCLDVLKW